MRSIGRNSETAPADSIGSWGNGEGSAGASCNNDGKVLNLACDEDTDPPQNTH